MSKITVLLILLLVPNEYSQPNVELISNLNEHQASRYNDIWGYVDPAGNEYALLCVRNGTSIISLADPENPVEISFIPATQTIWRDVKVHNEYAYVVSDGAADGLQIIDLTELPVRATLVKQTLSFFNRAHNIFIDEGFAYVVGTEGGGGMHILDLSDPVNPVETAYYIASGNIHDVYVWNDTVVVCAGFTRVYHLVNVTDKSNPQFINASIPLPGIFAHSGWMTEDKRYFYATDEFNQVDITVWDLQDRSTWDLVVPTWETSSNATIHNLFIHGNYAHISYYEDGYVVLDISDPESPILAGQYDTSPVNRGTYTGAWGVYPYLPSGLTIVSDTETGLYVFKFDTPTSVEDEELPISFSLNQNYPNPFNPSTNINFSIAEAGPVSLEVFNIIGEEVAVLVNEFMDVGSYTFNFSASNLSSGIYIARLTSGNNQRMIKMNLLK
jgi:choice-of-anchor B domain-containing protein